ncbi:MAG: ATP-binding protein [Kiloniellaceae bacterium]
MSGSKRLLLVTGNESEAAYVRASLAAGLFSHEITRAGSLPDAIAALSGTPRSCAPYDAILFDIGLNGCRPAEAVRRLATTASDTAILIIAGSADVPAAIEAVEEGAQDYILWSSFNGGALAHRLQFCIERFELEREMRRRLREAERLVARFDSLVRDNADAIMVLNMNGRVKFANTAAARLFGRDAASLIGSDPGIPVQRGAAMEIAIGRRGGSDTVVEIHIAQTIWDNEPVWLASLRDVSQRKNAERALVLAKQQAELASETKSKFLAHKSHEQRTPQNSILGITEIMQKGGVGYIENARYLDYLDTIRNSGTHLLTLINDLLDLSKIEAGREELQEETVDLPALLRAAAHAEEATARDHGLALVCEIERHPRLLRADPVKLNQIVLNLLSNAIKFTPEGGLVTLQGRPSLDGGYEIVVADTGCGMDPDDIPEAMGAFGQIRTPYIRKADRGTGLGLPIARSLAELHQGSLEIASRPGAGTSVTVLLPPERVLTGRVAAPVIASDGRAHCGS